jgi:glyoxylase I family protein
MQAKPAPEGRKPIVTPISAKLSAEMRAPRRRLLRFLCLGLGSKFLPGGSVFAVAAQAADRSKEAVGMEKVTGIGGLFFRAHDPKGLAQWYQEHLGVTMTPSSKDDPVWQQEAGQTVFAPFKEDTKYFGDMQKAWMVNFRVRDLDKMAAQLRAAGIEVKIDPQTYPNGRFARLHDPEGNPIELWQPVGSSASR